MPVFTPEQRKLFEEPNYVNVATLGKDGTPRSVAVWVDMDGEDIVLNGGRGCQWLANLRRNPDCGLSILDLKNPFYQVNVTGVVVDITEQGGEEHLDKLSHKYMGCDYPAHDPENPRNIIRIRIKSIANH